MKFSKHLIPIITSVVLLCSCTPSNVKSIQHKIDKALEATPSYDSLKEIQISYDELLSDEQDMVKNYDKIQSLLELNANDIAGIFAVGTLQNELANPNSINLISATKKEDGKENIIVQIEYSAENSFGANEEDVYYIVLMKPDYNQQENIWSCGIEQGFNIALNLDRVNSLLNSLQSSSATNENTAQQEAQRDYQKIENEESLDKDKILDNLNYFSKIKDTTKPLR